MTLPFWLTANRLTGESVRMVVRADRIFLSSQTFTVLSSDPDISLSSFAKIVDVTLLDESGRRIKKYSSIN